jgi:small subunit ribosomal protein S20
MPNRKNAIIQLRKDEKRRERNRASKSRLKTARSKFESILEDGNTEEVQKAFVSLQSLLDNTAKKGVIPANRASRIKSRYASKINGLEG